MLVSVRDLEDLAIQATDGDIGSVHDFYFDDRSWTIRYLVVDTGSWLPGRRVLVSPMSVREARWSDRRLSVALTKAQVEGSPDIDTARPISRQHELLFTGYYGLAPYWDGPYRWGAVPDPVTPGHAAPAGDPMVARALEREGLENVGPPHLEGRHLRDEHGDADLRSAREVIGHRIEAADGEIGHVEDFLVDDRTWAVRYMVIDTRNWWPGKKVLIAPEWIGEMSWPDARVTVNMTRDQIRNAPEYDPSRPLEPEEERRLLDHYRGDRAA